MVNVIFIRPGRTTRACSPWSEILWILTRTPIPWRMDVRTSHTVVYFEW